MVCVTHKQKYNKTSHDRILIEGKKESQSESKKERKRERERRWRAVANASGIDMRKRDHTKETRIWGDLTLIQSCPHFQALLPNGTQDRECRPFNCSINL